MSRTFFHSFKISGTPTIKDEKIYKNPANQNEEVLFYNSQIIASAMYGFVYYPIDKRLVLNPFGRFYAGIGGHSADISLARYVSGDYVEDDKNFIEINNHDRAKRPVSLVSRLNAGIEINFSHIKPIDKPFSNSLYFAVGLNVMGRGRAYESGNVNGENLITANIINTVNGRKYAMEIGEYYEFRPVFLTFEIGVILREVY